tara:strand:+ start:165 stop:575 length:411 start_codon:yes stop_codon:yes gene_type:complete
MAMSVLGEAPLPPLPTSSTCSFDHDHHATGCVGSPNCHCDAATTDDFDATLPLDITKGTLDELTSPVCSTTRQLGLDTIDCSEVMRDSATPDTCVTSRLDHDSRPFILVHASFDGAGRNWPATATAARGMCNSMPD